MLGHCGGSGNGAPSFGGLHYATTVNPNASNGVTGTTNAGGNVSPR